MLLGPSGQNIYPEEMEAKLSNYPYVLECGSPNGRENRPLSTPILKWLKPKNR